MSFHLKIIAEKCTSVLNLKTIILEEIIKIK